MASRTPLILLTLVFFALGLWGGRQIRSDSAVRPEAATVETAPSSPAMLDSLDSAAALRARIEATPTAGLAALHEELADRRWPDLDSLLAYRTLLERCLREDPESLMTVLNGHLDERRAQDLVQVWLEVDAKGLLTRVFSDSSTGTLRREVAFAAPREFLEAASLREDRVPESDAEIGSAILRVSEADPRGAIAWLDRFALREDTRADDLVTGTHGVRAIGSVHAEVAARFASVDPAAALAWAQDLTTPVGKKTVTTAVLASWALADPEAATEAFSGLAEASALRSVSIAQRMAATDPERAFRWLDQSKNQEINYYSIHSLSSHIRDPLLLQRIESELTDATMRNSFLHMHLSDWGDRPLEAGLEWALSTEPESRSVALAALAIGLKHVPYDEAVQLSEQIDDKTLRDSFLAGFGTNLYETDPIRSIEIARGSGNEAEFRTTIRRAASHHASRSDFSPKEVYAWTKQLGDDSVQETVYQNLAKRFYRRNPAEATKWIEALESGRDKTNLLRGLGVEMANNSPETAIEWVLELTDPEHRNELIPIVASNLSSRLPEKAFTLALTAPSSDREDLLDILTRSVRTWARRDPAAARAAVANAPGLSERERRTLTTWIYAP